jgi:putative acetyltransferase
VKIRKQRPDEADAVRRALTSAFADDGRVADLAVALDRRADRRVAPLVAVAGDEIVGVVQLSRGWVDAPARLVEVLVLSPLGVVPAWQRRGVGTALCAAGLADARKLAIPAVFLEGDPAYYGRLGWDRASARGFTAPSKRIPDAGFQVALLPSWQPTMAGALVYNDTFWAHDLVGLRPPG